MKKTWISVLFLVVLSACSENADQSAKNKLDSLAKKADSVSDRVGDSLKSKGRSIKERVKEKFERDSARK